MQIRTLTEKDIDRIAQIHHEELPDDFCALLGLEFLQSVYYPELFKVCDVKLGAVDNEDTVQGFAIFSADKKFLRRLVTYHPIKLLESMDWRAFLRPHFFRYVVEVLILILTPDDRLRGAEFAYFGVSKKHQGKWLGFQLIRHGFSELRDLGITHSWLRTLDSTPQNVQFYEKIGFKRLKLYLGRVYMTREITEADTRPH